MIGLEYPKCYRGNSVLPKPPNLPPEEVPLTRSLPRPPTIHVQNALSFCNKKLPHYSSFTYLKNSVFSSSDFSVKVFRKFTTSRKSFLSTKTKICQVQSLLILKVKRLQAPTIPLAERTRQRGPSQMLVDQECQQGGDT